MKNQIAEEPLIKVKTIKLNLIEQLYPTRTELGTSATVRDGEKLVGYLTNGCGILIADNNGRLRMQWPYNIAVGLGHKREEHGKFFESLPQIFID